MRQKTRFERALLWGHVKLWLFQIWVRRTFGLKEFHIGAWILYYRAGGGTWKDALQSARKLKGNSRS